MTHQCGSCTDAGCTGLCRREAALQAMADEMQVLDALTEVDRLRRVLGECWAVLKGADMLTRDELCDELEVVLGGLPAAHERRAANQRDRLAHGIREALADLDDAGLSAVKAVVYARQGLRAALAEIES